MRRKQFTSTQKQHIARELLDGRLSKDEGLLKYELRLKKTLRKWVADYRVSESRLLTAEPDPPAAASAPLAAQLRQAQWQIEALYTLIDQAEATYKIAIRKKAGAKPSTYCAGSTRVGVGTLCGLFGKTRNAFYDHQRRATAQALLDSLVLALVS